jgi:hypothetical protein
MVEIIAQKLLDKGGNIQCKLVCNCYKKKLKIGFIGILQLGRGHIILYNIEGLTLAMEHKLKGRQ